MNDLTLISLECVSFSSPGYSTNIPQESALTQALCCLDVPGLNECPDWSGAPTTHNGPIVSGWEDN